MKEKSRQPSFSAQQLEWVKANRQPRSRTGAVGDLAQEVLDSQLSHLSRNNDLLQAICECVDDEFRRSCRLGSVNGNEVEILVNHPDSLYHMRTTWHLPLKEYLERACPRRTIGRITFKQGTGGISLESPQG